MKILIESIYVYIVCPIAVLFFVGVFFFERNNILNYWRDEFQKNIDKDGRINGGLQTLVEIILIVSLIVVLLYLVLAVILYAIAGNRFALVFVISYGVVSIIYWIFNLIKKEWADHEISVLTTLIWMLLGLFMYYYIFPIINLGTIGVAPEILSIQQFWKVLSGYFVR